MEVTDLIKSSFKIFWGAKGNSVKVLFRFNYVLLDNITILMQNLDSF
jgi:hypothetical protein